MAVGVLTACFSCQHLRRLVIKSVTSRLWSAGLGLVSVYNLLFLLQGINDAWTAGKPKRQSRLGSQLLGRTAKAIPQNWPPRRDRHCPTYQQVAPKPLAPVELPAPVCTSNRRCPQPCLCLGFSSKCACVPPIGKPKPHPEILIARASGKCSS